PARDDERTDVRDAGAAAVAPELGQYTSRGPRIREQGGPHLHQVGPGEQILKRVRAGADPARADDRDGDALTSPPDGVHAHGQNGGAADPAGPGADDGPAGLEIEEEAREGVDQSQAVGAGADRDLGHAADIRHVGRELGDERPAGEGTHGADDLGEEVLPGGEHGAAFLDIRARQVELEGEKAGQRVEALDHLDVVLDRAAGDVDEDLRATQAAGQPGELLLGHPVEPDVGEADGVDHAALEFRDAGRRVALAWLRGDGLDREAA